MIVTRAEEKTARKRWFAYPKYAFMNLGVNQIGFRCREFEQHRAFVFFLANQQIIGSPAEGIDDANIITHRKTCLWFVAFFIRSPRAITARLFGIFADWNRLKLIFFDGQTNDISHNETIFQGLIVKKLFQKPFGVRSALTVRGDDDGSVVVQIFQKIFKTRPHICVSDLKSLPCRSRISGVITEQMRLPIARRKNPPNAIKNARLVQNRAIIGLQIQFLIRQIAIPIVISTVKSERSWVQKKNVHLRSCLLIFKICAFRNTIGGVIFIGMSRPIFEVIVVWRNGRFGLAKTRFRNLCCA